MISIFKIALGALLTASLTGCPGMVPQGGGPASPGGPASTGMIPTAAQKEESPDSSSPGDLPGDNPSGAAASNGVVPFNPPGSFDAVANPHPGGVSAMPADVEGGEDKTEFEFTLTGSGEAICMEPSGRGAILAWLPQVKYRVQGQVGAALMDGTPVPLGGCEVLTVRFQEGSGNDARCEDVSLKQDCKFIGAVSLRRADSAKVFLFLDYSQGKDPDFHTCGDMEGVLLPHPGEVKFSATVAEKLPVCVPPTMDGSILSNPNLKSKLPAQ